MIVTNRYNTCNTYPGTSFTSRSKTLKEIGDISRLTQLEFQMTSTSKLTGYGALKKRTEFKQYRKYIDNRIGDLRLNTAHITNTGKTFIKNLAAIKKFRVGNCVENAESVYTALQMNGVNNAEIMWLYAYNPKTRKIREIDHTVVGVNFKKPKDYKYCPLYQMHFGLPEEKHLLRPGNTGIIVDSWSGITEYGKEAEVIYRYDKSLIRYSNERAKMRKEPVLETLLEPDEQLCYVPHGQIAKFSEDELTHLRQKYPNLLLPKNRSASEKTTTTFKEYLFPLACEERENELRERFGLKKAVGNMDSKITKPKNFIARLKSFIMKNF